MWLVSAVAAVPIEADVSSASATGGPDVSGIPLLLAFLLLLAPCHVVDAPATLL